MSFKNTTILWLILASLVCFIPFAYLTDRTDAFEIMNAMLGSFGVFTFISVAPDTWKIMKLPARDLRASHILMVAIAVGSICLAVIFTTLWVWRAFPDLQYVISTWWTLLTRWELLLSFVLVIATRFNREGVITPAGWKRTVLLIAGAATLAIVLVVIGATHDN
jgi:hypothetical protein